MKILSVIIPAYNVEKYIQRCLDSLVFNEKCLKDLDVIVVDDGSQDQTYEIARQYEEKYPDSVRVIKKENGGHGSTINLGLERANGKYIKILDGDDWLNIFDLPEFVNRLTKEKADVVVTNYRRVLLYKEKERYFEFSQNTQDGKVCEIDDAVKEIKGADFFFRFSMPSMTVKTEVLKRVWGEGLPEKRFYVDQLFVAKVLLSADTYIIYNLDIYRHDQSIDAAGFYRHRFDHEFVLKLMLEMYKTTKNKSKKEILKRQLILMLETQYQIYFYKRSLFKKDRKELMRFDKFLRENYNDLYKVKTTRINVLRRIR